jgi:hypothetical protein
MAEREGFEPPIDLRLCLISSQVHSTGLCHLSALLYFISGLRLAACASQVRLKGHSQIYPDDRMASGIRSYERERSLRRTTLATPRMPVPNSVNAEGSGTVGVLVLIA